ncbi:MAG: hypothetical protein ACRC76_03070 [Proteocatella sp.]
MMWKKTAQETNNIWEIGPETIGDSNLKIAKWGDKANDNSVDLTKLKTKHFQTPVSIYSAEVISTRYPATWMLNSQSLQPLSPVNIFPEPREDLIGYVEPKKIANFSFDIIDRIEKNYPDDTREKWLRIVIFFEEQNLRLDIKLDNYISLGKEIRRQYPQCYIYNDDEFNKMASEVYARACPNLSISQMYYFAGWHKEGQRWRFLHNAMQNVEACIELCTGTYRGDMLLSKYLDVSSEKDKLWVLLLYVLWAPLAKFYEVGNIDGLRSVLYLSAPTGTGKTTLARIFAQAFLCDGAKVELRFDDTKASLQESVISRKDIICLVDDFYAKGTKCEDADFKSKASELTRIVGDGCVKGKMGPNRKPLPDRRYRGGVIATGEYIDLNTHSSYLRCWMLNFPAKSIYFNDSLTFLQKNPDLIKGFLSSWIFYLEKNQANIMKKLSLLHDEFLTEVRGKYPEAYPRFHTNVTTFLVVADLFTAFCKNNRIELDVETLRKAILWEADDQLRLLRGISPEAIFEAALAEAFDNAYLRIAESENEFKKHEYDGFNDGQGLFIITARLEAIVTKYAEKQGYGMKLNDGLKNSLADKGILVKTGNIFNSKYSKNREIEPKRPRLYKLKFEVDKNGK